MDILDALLVLHHVCQLCSLTQWRLVRSDRSMERRLQRSRWLELYGWTMLCAASGYTVYGLLEQQVVAPAAPSTVGYKVDFIQLLGIRVAHAVALLETLWQRSAQRDFYNEVREIDRLFLCALNVNVQNRRLQQRTACRAMSMFSGYLASQLFILATKLLAAEHSFPLYWLYYLLPLLICGLRYFQIYTAVHIVRQRLDLLVQEVSALRLATAPSAKCVQDEAAAALSAAAMQRIQVTRQLYQRCWALVNVLNRCFGLSMLVQVGNDFISITSNCYWIFLNINQFVTSPYDFLQVVGSAVWSIPHLSNVLVLALLCERAAQCTTNLALTLHRISVDLQNECHNALITQFSLQLLHQRLNFSAAGFFNVDCTLLYTIVGATTTYLIILIQFHMSETSLMSGSR